MRLTMLFLFLLFGATAASACSLELTTETLFGNSAGTVCSNLSDVKTDRRGEYRSLDYDVRHSDGELEEFPAITLRARRTIPLRKVKVPGLGNVNLMTLKVNSMNAAIVKFLNGNSITIKIDANGRVTPGKICIKQTGVSQLRGFAGRCP